MYQSGMNLYLRANHKSGLMKNDMVTILGSKKKKHRTYLDVVDTSGNIIRCLSVKFLRKRPRK